MDVEFADMENIIKIGAECLKLGRAKSIKLGREEGLERGRKEGMEKSLNIGLEVGKMKGLEKGRAEGLEKGRTEGREKGLKKGEREKALEVARKMLAADTPVDKIAMFSGLAEEEILKLRDETRED
jgi:predicted transposase YdaD